MSCNRLTPAVPFVQTMVVHSCMTAFLEVHNAGNASQILAQRAGTVYPSSGTCALLADVRLAYSHVVVLDSFFGEAEREALLSQLTERDWDHAQVGLALGSGLPKAYSQRML